MATITVLNGPNLNLLGVREPGHYGNKTLADIQQLLEEKAAELNHQLDFHQNNAEHHLVELIHRAYENQVDFIIINPAAFTHTSVAIRDALLATRPFRKHSYFSDIAQGVICGLGATGYELALLAAHQILTERP